MKIRRAVIEDVDGIVHVHIHSLKSSHNAILPDEFLDGLDNDWSEPRFTQTLKQPLNDSLIYVAEDDYGAIVGFIWGGRERKGNDTYKGEIYAIYILQAYQRKGLGRRLTFELANHLQDLGIHSLLVWVIANNYPSRSFYEGIGGRKVSEGTFEMMGNIYRDVAYGWTDISQTLLR
jgi:ribosomal protein S18 acetylase RimI-like enzyme